MRIWKSGLLLTCLIGCGAVSGGELKIRSTYYTPDRLAALSEERETSKARQTLKKQLAAADAIVALSPERLAEMVKPPEIPRAFMVHIDGCPECGKKIYEHGGYPWIINEEKPFKVQCPVCRKFYPDNDYYSYWKSGFTDRSKLEGKYVDDGWGYRDPKSPKKYWFVAYYNHWTYHRLLNSKFDALLAAYLATGKPAYAERAGFLLWHLSTFWKDYDHNKQSRYATEFDSNYRGRVINAIWETAAARIYPRVYDGVFPALQEENEFLRGLTNRSMAEMRDDIEENLLRQMARDIMIEPVLIRGNFGMHQSGLMQIAKVLEGVDGQPDSKEMINWITSYVDKHSGGVNTPLDYALYNSLFGDGVPYESPGYNILWLGHMTNVFNELAEHGCDYWSSFPGLRQLYSWQAKMVVAGKFTPALGDTGNINAPLITSRLSNNLAAFRRFQDPEVAALIVLSNPVYRETASESDAGGSDAALRREVAAAAAQADPLLFYRSNHLPGYGFASLQNRNPDNPAGLAFMYGFYPSHCHREKLHVEFFADDAALTPDFGYPDTASNMDSRRYGYFVNTLTHNTVVVDAEMQKLSGGNCLVFDSGKFAQFIEADAREVYPQTSIYRRALLSYDRGDGGMITLDVFRVRGGRQHDYFFHGSGPEFETNLALSEAEPGTLAGHDVEYGKFYDDPKFRDISEGSASYAGYGGSGYQYLYGVRRGVLTAGARAVFYYPGRERRTGVVMHPVGMEEDFIASTGKLQLKQHDPGEVAYLTRRRQAVNGNLESSFANVIEPGALPGAVAKVETLVHEFGRTLLRLRLADGGTHYVYNALEPIATPLKHDGFEFSGQAGVLMLDPAGTVKRAYICNHGAITRQGEVIVAAAAPFEALIAEVDLLKRTIVLTDPVPEEFNRGQYFYTDRKSFLPAGISGRRIDLGDYSPVSGRGKLTSYDPKTGGGVMIPGPMLMRSGMWLYAADGTTPIGQISLGRRAGHFGLGANRNHAALAIDSEKGVSDDLWIGELAPGESVKFVASEAK